uniref:Uncharacterized protein n=1 Tax=Anguilla anguilla TaxID=7936 RepID=A0A0E9REJ5_ANGAN
MQLLIYLDTSDGTLETVPTFLFPTLNFKLPIKTYCINLTALQNLLH